MNKENVIIEVRKGDCPQVNSGQKMPLVLILDRLRSAFNVGNIFRLADAVAAEEVALCGYTACPPHPKLAKTARGCEELVKFRQYETTLEAINLYTEQGYRIYAVETVAAAESVWEVDFVFPAALVLGNEALGISQDALQKCDEFIQLPCNGVKNSINVGNCAAVVLYKALEAWCGRGRQTKICDR